MPAKLTTTSAWKALADHTEVLKQSKQTIAGLFKEDPNRWQQFHLKLDGLLFDFSKHLITPETLKLLVELAKQEQLMNWREKMFAGTAINFTEQRAVLHTALRNLNDPRPEVATELEKVRQLSTQIREGTWKGYSGRAITDIVNIGIGGSDLGPKMVTTALEHFHHERINVHFVSNVDASDIVETLNKLRPDTTLFLVSSKTFTTQETMTNAETAKQWFMASSNSERAIKKHFVAVTTNVKAASAFGIDPDNILTFWDYVGGRYSLWSSIGFSIACYIGFDKFIDLLRGAETADEHFREMPLHKNIPVMMGLLGIWYNNFWDAQTHAVFPYDHYLRLFPSYLQQLEMESNGKSTDRDGNIIDDYNTGSIVWGEPGTNGQHSFFQLLHQGTRLVPADFIGFKSSLNPEGNHHQILTSHLLAQTNVMLNGYEPENGNKHQLMQGNRPTTTFLFDKLSPYNLGMLIALYEHKVFTQGIIWRINSFDQFGVERGKKMASQILDELSGTAPHDKSLDGSTSELIKEIRGN